MFLRPVRTTRTYGQCRRSVSTDGPNWYSSEMFITRPVVYTARPLTAKLYTVMVQYVEFYKYNSF